VDAKPYADQLKDVYIWIVDEQRFYFISADGSIMYAETSDLKIAAASCPVKISEISENGFRLQVLNKDYYLTRKRYPYFSDATEAEIRDVVLQFHTNLRWEMLDLDFELEQLDHPEEGYAFNLFVRGVARPDLFAQYALDQNGHRLIPKS
jgi:hypothetical protein